MKLRLAQCCYFVSLRLGCVLVTILDVCMHLVSVNYGKSEILELLSRVIYMAHFVGCLMLFISTTVETWQLVLVYLITDSVQFLFCLASAYSWFHCRRNSVLTISLNCINMVTSIYFWLVAYSYYWLCKNTLSNTENIEMRS